MTYSGDQIYCGNALLVELSIIRNHVSCATAHNSTYVHRHPFGVPRATRRCGAPLRHMALRPGWAQGHVTYVRFVMRNASRRIEGLEIESAHRKACVHLHALGHWLSWLRMNSDISGFPGCNECAFPTTRTSFCDPGNCTPDLLPVRTRASGCNAVSHRKACDHLHALGAWLSRRRMHYDNSRSVVYNKHTPTTSRVSESAIRAVSFLTFSRLARVPLAVTPSLTERLVTTSTRWGLG